MRLDSSGAVTWTRSATGGVGRGVGLKLDSAGNALVAGYYTGTVNFGSNTLTSVAGSQDAFIWKLNASGTPVWAGSMGSDGTDYAWDLALDAGGNVVVDGSWSGSSSNSNFNPGSGKAVKLTNHGSSDIFVTKLIPGPNGSLTLTWAKGVGGSGYERAEGVALDGSGNVYATGIFAGTVNFNPNNGQAHYLNGGSDAGYVLKLTSSGNYADVAGIGLGGIGGSRSVVVDGSGNVYATGQFGGTGNFSPNGKFHLTSNGGSTDLFVLKLTQSGTSPFAGGSGSGDFSDQSNLNSNTPLAPATNRAAQQQAGSRGQSIAELGSLILHGVSLDHGSEPLAASHVLRIAAGDDEVLFSDWLNIDV
jgi:hypothetical protein